MMQFCPLADVGDIHLRGAQRIQKDIPVLTDHARVEDFRTGFGQGDGLVQPLPAAEQVLVRGQEGFSGLDDMVHLIDMIKID